jgi:uncharacterized protein DUF1259
VHNLSVAARGAALAAALGFLPSTGAAQADWAAVDRAMGRPGVMQPGEVRRYSFPRADLHVSVDGVVVRPALALGSWVALRQAAGGHAIAMGDLVLLESEVTPVLSALSARGITVTALHNHLQRESPLIMYMHVEGEGDPRRIAETIHAALDLTGTPPAPPTAATGAFDLDTARLASALGHGGKVNGGVYQVSVPRAEPVRMAGMEVPPAMGVATAINFQPTGGAKAAITGDFVLTADEVNPVLKALRGGGIEVTALHSHMLSEQPRLFFMHFWADDDAVRLAGTLRAALDHTRTQSRGT